MKKFTHLLAALVLSAASFFLPVTKTDAFAANPADTSVFGRVQINGATSLEDVSNGTSVTATFANGTATITGTGLYSDGNNMIYALGSVAVAATPAADYTATLWSNGTNLNTNTTNFNMAAGNFQNMDIIFESAGGGGGGGGQSQGNTHATITTSAGAGTYTINGQSRSYDSDPFMSMEAMASLSINDTMWDPATDAIDYDSDNADTTVDFKFGTLWINKYYDDIVINGTSYSVATYLDFNDRTAWLNANHGSQLIEFTIPNVPKADSYNIVVKHGENNGTRYLATFLWTADPAQAGSHDYIGHSKLEFVRAEYEVGGTNYTVTEQDLKGHLVRDGRFLTFRSADGFLQYGVTADVDFDDGSLTLPGGAKVTMRVVPEYGYQVTEVNGGGAFTTTDTGVSEFTVVVADGTAGYFRAEVTAVDDEVVSNSDKVSGGSIELADGDIDAGTARLSVDDVDLPENKVADFKKQVAGSYNVSSFIDINLNKVLYKGTADDVWSEQIHHLKKKALISLKLKDGVDGNDIVIIHNIDNGDEYEVIDIVSYDPETNIITFWVSSFSDYAIASRTVASPNSGAKAATSASFVTSTLSTTILIATVFSAGAWMAFRSVKK